VRSEQSSDQRELSTAPQDFDDFAPPQPINRANLASNAGYQYNATIHAADGQSCRGRLSYSVHKTLLLF
jgi:hypothetical protein